MRIRRISRNEIFILPRPLQVGTLFGTPGLVLTPRQVPHTKPRRPTHSYAQTMLYHIAPSPVVRGTLHAYTPPILQNDTVQNPEQSRPAQAVQATQLLSRGTQAPHASSTCQTTPRAAPVLLLAPYTCLTAALRWPTHGTRLWPLSALPRRRWRRGTLPAAPLAAA